MSGHKRITLRYIIIATLLGNTVQWYDYHLFNFLAPILFEVFFPPEDLWTHVSYSTFLLVTHSISRILGSFVFGIAGDLKGRKFALVASISLMTCSSLCIGLTPSYSQAGWLAPILFAFFRSVQSFAAGGEFTGGMLYLVESAPLAKRGFYGSFSFFGLSLGILFSSLNFFIFGFELSEMHFLKWGWRMLYLFGAFAGFLVFLLRRRFHETHLFLEAKHEIKGEKNPFLEMMSHHKKALVKTFGIGVLETVAFNLLVGFLLGYWNERLEIPLKKALQLNCFAAFFFPFFIIAFGKLTSLWKIKSQAITFSLFFIFCSIPLFFLMEIGGDVGKVVGLIVFLAFLSGYMVSLPALYCELFPTRIRFIGVSLGYNFSVALIGSATPEIIHFFSRGLSFTFDAGIYLTVAALISLAFLLRTKEKIISVR